jgi:hypothetical protein
MLFYRLLIRLMIDYASPILRSAALTHVQKLQVLQLKCLRTMLSNKKVHEEMGPIDMVDELTLLLRIRKVTDLSSTRRTAIMIEALCGFPGIVP